MQQIPAAAGMHLYANGYRPVMDALLPLLRKIGEEQGGKQ